MITVATSNSPQGVNEAAEWCGIFGPKKKPHVEGVVMPGPTN